MALPKLAGELYQLFDQSKYQDCQALLTPIKIELIKHNLLVPLPLNTQEGNQLNDLKIAERILEIGALSLLFLNEYENFESSFASLRPFYLCPQLHAQREANTEATKIISLYLIYLLSQGLISKFHVELEYIYNTVTFDVDHDKYLKYPIELEKSLMEGDYIKIWKLLQNDALLPCPECRHFKDTLVNTLRYEIAKSLEKTNRKIPISNCKTLLYFPQEQSDLAFEQAVKLELDVSGWEFKDGFIHFQPERKTDSISDNAAIIKNVLSYAELIESIV